jgi:putative oxidoreductase
VRGVGLLLLRVVVGGIFILHGLPKLWPVFGGSSRAAAALFDAAELVPAYPLAVGTGIVELLAGILLVGGAYTSWITLLLSVTTIATGWKLHASAVLGGLQPGSSTSIELDIVLIGALVCLLFTGPGVLSVDARRRAAETDTMGRAQLRTRRT